MMQRVFIPYVLPSLNDLLASARSHKGKWQAYNDQKNMLEFTIGVEIRRAHLKPMPNGAHLTFIWIEKNRKRDKDNVAAGGTKLICDALVRKGILPTDGWKGLLTLTHQFLIVDPSLKEVPGVEVVLRTA